MRRQPFGLEIARSEQGAMHQNNRRAAGEAEHPQTEAPPVPPTPEPHVPGPLVPRGPWADGVVRELASALGSAQRPLLLAGRGAY